MLRADAIATLYFVHPLRRFFSSSEGRIPILMYHSISDSITENRHPYYRTVTTPAVFAEHMKYLHENGYSATGLTEALECARESERSGRRPVVITFDDGFQDFFSNAFPVLEKYGFTATMYLPTGYIGDVLQKFKGIECLTWNQVRELRSAGIEFGSHTVTHPQLKLLQDAGVEHEVRTSKDTIEQQLGFAVRSFAYPYAFPETDNLFTGRLREMLRIAGYDNGVSTIVGTAHQSDDRYFLKRLPMNDCDDTRLLGAKLYGAYDWLHTAQYVSKVLTTYR